MAFLWIGFDALSAILFVMILSYFLYKNRDKIVIQKIVGYVFYIIMYKTKLGLKLMDKIATKFGGFVRLLGYISIVLGFTGMALISYSIIMLMVDFIFKPELQQPGFALVVPFTNIPGIGYLSFWHWIIAIFILAAIHEFSHGVVARAHGLEVKSSGFAIMSLLVPLIPAAFVEPDEKKLQKQKASVQFSVFAAGPAVNIFFAFAIIFALPYTTDLSNQALAPYEEKFIDYAGFSYNLLNESYPASIAGMPDNGTITAVNGVQTNTFESFRIQMEEVKPGDTVGITVNGTAHSVITIPNPDGSDRAFVGIRPVANEIKLRDGVPAWQTGAFYWFKGMFKWLMWLNLFIGLANLLPLGIVDGGRMIGVAINKVIKDEKTAQKVWGLIAFLFLLMLLFGLIVEYLGNPFSLFI